MNVEVLEDAAPVSITREWCGSLVIRRYERELTGKSAAELLDLTAQLSGNLRYAKELGGDVVLLGELRGSDPTAARREFAWQLGGGVPNDHTDRKNTTSDSLVSDLVEAALDASGFRWSRRESGWAVPAADRLPRELRVSRIAGGIRVEAILAEWDGASVGETARIALGEFLCAAQSGLWFARCELNGQSARIVSQINASSLEDDLPHSLLGLASAIRLLADEADSLLVAEVAAAYLRFHGMPVPS